MRSSEVRKLVEQPPRKPPERPAPAPAEVVPGDVVRIKSGGPAMTVSLLGRPFVFCVWFDPDFCYGEEWLHEAALERAEA